MYHKKHQTYELAAGNPAAADAVAGRIFTRESIFLCIHDFFSQSIPLKDKSNKIKEKMKLKWKEIPNQD